MSRGNRSECGAAVMLVALFILFSRPASAGELHTSPPKPTLFPFLSAACAVAIPAKNAAAGKDSMVVTRLTMYQWAENDWVPDGDIDFTYDDRGHIIEWIDNSTLDDSTSSRTTFEYNEHGKNVREMTFTRDSSSGSPSIDLAIAEYYFGDQGNADNLYSTSFSLSAIDLGNSKVPAMDSVIRVYSTWNSSTESWDTTHHFKHSYSYSSNSVRIAYEDRMTGTAGQSADQYEDIYKLNSSGLVDTIVKYCFDDYGNRYDFGCITYEYQNGKLISMLAVRLGDEIGLFPYEQKISVCYSPAGVMDSYIVDYRYSSSEPWKKMLKIVFVYSSISIPVIEPFSSSKSIGALFVARKGGRLLLAAPSGMNIAEILHLDLQGRVVNRFRPAGSRQTGSPAALPFRVPDGSITLLRVRTNRGDCTFRVKGSIETSAW
ncbi:MAG: hypothetical protein JXA18_17045 [Chitinispirillaceae bacterium]|nr:hypothetical protein [Chitinispirillaceae bacterium]